MNKPSDGMDLLDKGLEIHNYYIEERKRKLANEIAWVADNSSNVASLRAYLAQYLEPKRVEELSDKAIEELAEIRANYLFLQMKNLGEKKVDTLPVKLIVQTLKNMGY
jgi:hypothetical protein